MPTLVLRHVESWRLDLESPCRTSGFARRVMKLRRASINRLGIAVTRMNGRTKTPWRIMSGWEHRLQISFLPLTQDQTSRPSSVPERLISMKMSKPELLAGNGHDHAHVAHSRDRSPGKS